MYFFFYGKVNVGVISADYTEQNFEDYSYEEVAHHICEEFKSEYANYCKENGIEPEYALNMDENIVILWRNVPDTTKDKVHFDKAFELICNEAEENGISPFLSVYIRSAKDLIDTYGFEKTIDYLYRLNKMHRTVVFFDNQYFSTDGTQDVNEHLTGDTVDDAIKKVIHGSVGKYRLSSVLGELNKLIPETEQDKIEDFVLFYWGWQHIKKSIDDCREDLGIYHATFYKFAQLYEQSPYYCEHLKLFFNIQEVAKRGRLPNKEEFLSDKKKLDANEIPLSEFCAKYDIAATVDIPRIEKALTEPRKRRRQ